MKKLILILSGLFLSITLFRVAAFVSHDLRTGILGWFFSVGLGVAVYSCAYWTRIKTTRSAAIIGLIFFISVDSFFNMAEVWLSVSSDALLVRIGALVYGAFPTLAIALLGWLNSRIALTERGAAHDTVIDALLRKSKRMIDAWAEIKADPEAHDAELMAHEPKPMPYICGACGKGYESSGAYASHIRWNHSNGHKKEAVKELRE